MEGFAGRTSQTAAAPIKISASSRDFSTAVSISCAVSTSMRATPDGVPDGLAH